MTTPGGVGRNIAENLARLGTPTHLVAPVGRDAFGEELVAQTRAAGVVVDHVIQTDDATGTYLAVLDADGELLVAVSNMEVTDRLTVRRAGRLPRPHRALRPPRPRRQPAAGPGRLAAGLRGSDGRARRHRPGQRGQGRAPGRVAHPGRPLLALTPNHDELAAIVRRPVPRHRGERGEGGPRDPRPRGQHVWVRRGLRGSLLELREDAGKVTVDAPRRAQRHRRRRHRRR